MAEVIGILLAVTALILGLLAIGWAYGESPRSSGASGTHARRDSPPAQTA